MPFMLKISRYCAKILKVAISLDKDQQKSDIDKRTQNWQINKYFTS